MDWILLIIAGFGECFWATTMKLSNGFTNIGYTIITVVGMLLSFGTLIIATKTLPLSLAYPIWTGIGAVGSVVIGCVFFKENINPLTSVFVVLLIVSIIGIKMTSGSN